MKTKNEMNETGKIQMKETLEMNGHPYSHCKRVFSHHLPSVLISDAELQIHVLLQNYTNIHDNIVDKILGKISESKLPGNRKNGYFIIESNILLDSNLSYMENTW